MGKCELECPDGGTECCICCEKQGGCDNRCDMMDSYEYAEECENYEAGMLALMKLQEANDGKRL